MNRIGFTSWLACMCLLVMSTASPAQTGDSFVAQLIVVEIGPVPRAAQQPQPAAQFAVNRLTDGSSLNAPCSPVPLAMGSNVNPPLLRETFRRISHGCSMDLVVQLPLINPLSNAYPDGSQSSPRSVVVAVVVVPDVPGHVPVRVTLGIRSDPRHETGPSVLPAAQVFRTGE